jgi:hypothetical protein
MLLHQAAEQSHFLWTLVFWNVREREEVHICNLFFRHIALRILRFNGVF